MKPHRLLSLSTFALLAFAAFAVPLQAEPTNAAPDNPPGPAWNEGRPRGPRLTPEEREKLKTVREQVFKDHPELAQERDALKTRAQALETKIHTLMIAANPAVKPILEKLPSTPPADGERPERPNLTPEEQKLLKETRKSVVEANPDLATEFKSLHEARTALEKKIRDAMIVADPSVKELLAKLPPRGPGGDRGPDGGKPRPHRPDGAPKPGA